MKYNKKTVDIICQSLTKMSSKTAAAEAAGISLQTYFEWYHNKPEFKKSIDKAIDETKDRAKSIAIQAVFQAMDKNWQAAAWFLERSYPNEYGRKDRIDMDVNEKKIVFQIGVKDNEDMVRFIEGTKPLELEGKNELEEDANN